MVEPMDPKLQLRYVELMSSFSSANTERLPLQIQMYPSDLSKLAAEWQRKPFGWSVELITFKEMAEVLFVALADSGRAQDQVFKLKLHRRSSLNRVAAKKLNQSQGELAKLQERCAALYSGILAEHRFLTNSMELDELIQLAGVEALIGSTPDDGRKDLEISRIEDGLRAIDERRASVLDSINGIFRRIDVLYSEWEQASKRIDQEILDLDRA
jgi:hypothetical protein